MRLKQNNKYINKYILFSQSNSLHHTFTQVWVLGSFYDSAFASLECSHFRLLDTSTPLHVEGKYCTFYI